MTVCSPTSLARPLAALLAVVALLLVGVREASAQSVRVAPGETLSEIAARAGVSTGALAAANGISDPDRVIAGSALTIPSGSAGSSWSGSSSGSHRVRPGESLSEIAARSGVSTSALAAANGIPDPDHVVAGRLLTIPTGSASPSSASGSASAGSYRVRPGDTLSEIAARSGVSASALAAANGISDPDLVVVGRSLTIPGGSASSSSAPPRTMPVASVGALIDSHAAAYGVDPSLARAIAWQESGFNQNMVSPTGAVGVMQLMPGTARWLGRDVLGRPFDPHDVDDNVEGGVAYLKWLTNRVGDSPEAIAAYYQGLDSVRRIGLYDDTQQYVRSVQSLRGTR